MEPQCASVAKCTEYSNSALKWCLHHKQSQEHENIDNFCEDRDKFWSPVPDMQDWAAFNEQSQVMDHNLLQSCDSPLASDSSSSLSTWESSFFSWNSESSYTAGRHVLQSPELLSSRFMGFSLFNSGINHLELVSTEEDSNGNIMIRDERQEQFHFTKRDLSHGLVKLKQRTFDASIECSKPLDSEFHIAELSKEEFDDGWVSDSGDSQSWVSSSSQELTKKDPVEKANDMHLGRPCIEQQESPISMGSIQVGSSRRFLGTSHNHYTLEACESRSHAYSYMETTSSVSDICGCDSRHLGSEDINADALTHSNFMSSEKLCCANPHQPCRLIFAPETYQIQDCGPMAHNSEIEIVNERHVSDELFKGHGLHGHYELPEREENEHKPTKISQYDPARVDKKANLQLDIKHLLATSANTVVPTSLQSGDKTRPSSHTKSGYSAAVKERFASSILHGYLRFAEQNGSPCYSFFVDDSDEVLFARVSRQERQSNKENCNLTYTFHSKKDNGKAKAAWKGRPKKERLVSDLVANMKVPDVCKAKKYNGGHAKEARFVLYDGRGQNHVESLAIGNEKLQCQTLKPVFNNTAASQVDTQPRVKRCSMDSNSSCPKDCASNNTLNNGSCHLGNVKNASGSKGSCAERLNSCIIQQAELAAIVISTSVKEKKMTRRKESKPALTDSAGWGVKFLDKGPGSGWGLSFMEKSSSSSSGLEEMSLCTVPNSGGQLERIGAQTTGYHSNMAQLPRDKDSHSRTCPDLEQKSAKRLSSRKNRLKVDVTVILPAGDHGLPMEDEEDVGGGGYVHGPTPLLERWVSGGECECGGWDMECGLSVFKAETLSLHKRTANVALTRHDRMNWLSPGNPFKVFTQGYKQKKVLVLEIIEAGLFSLSFQARFSPLQAFATAVALFHQQMTHK